MVVIGLTGKRCMVIGGDDDFVAGTVARTGLARLISYFLFFFCGGER